MMQFEIRNGETYRRECHVTISDHGDTLEFGEWQKVEPQQQLDEAFEAARASVDKLSQAFASAAGAVKPAHAAIAEFAERLGAAVAMHDAEVKRWRELPMHKRIIESIRWDIDDASAYLQWKLKRHAGAALIATCAIILIAEFLFAWWAL